MKKLILSIIIISLSAMVYASHNPKIEITPESWDFGIATEIKTLTHKFQIKNAGDDTLKIKHITTSCDCVVVAIPFRKLYPNEIIELVVKFDLKQIKAKGKIKHDIIIETDDPENRFKIISLFVEL